MTKELANQIALVTGASRGIGRAAALELANRGAHIIAVARPRSQGQLEDLDDEIQTLGSQCTIAPLDLKDFDAIDRLGGALYERFGKLDILVGNAAVLGPISPLDHVSPKDWDEVMNVNVTANWRLIRSMAPLLKEAKGRAVFVTSAAAGKHKPFWGPYAASKAALDDLVLTYAAESKASGIRVNMVDPGPTRTHMRASAVPGEDPNTLPEPKDVAPLIADLCSPAQQDTGTVTKFYDWAGLKRP